MARTISTTPPAIEISPPWEIIVTFPPPRPLSELHFSTTLFPYFADGLRNLFLGRVALLLLSWVLGRIASLPPPLLLSLA